MLAHAEAQAVPSHRLFEQAYDVLLWTHLYRVPPVVLRIPEIEIIVVHAHAHEIFRAGLLVHSNQMLGVELIAFPCGNDVLKPEFARVAKGRDMILVLLMALNVHIPRVPVALLRSGLRTPVRPYTELRVPVPLRDFIGSKRFASALKFSFLDFQSFCVEGKRPPGPDRGRNSSQHSKCSSS